MPKRNRPTETETEADTINVLDDYCLVTVLSFLGCELSLKCASLVCRRWRALILFSEHTERLWGCVEAELRHPRQVHKYVPRITVLFPLDVAGCRLLFPNASDRPRLRRLSTLAITEGTLMTIATHATGLKELCVMPPFGCGYSEAMEKYPWDSSPMCASLEQLHAKGSCTFLRRARFPNLRSIVLSNCLDTGKETFQKLVRESPLLREVICWGTPSHVDSFVLRVEHLEALEGLLISEVFELESPQCLCRESLTDLGIAVCPGTALVDVFSVISRLPSLRRLSLVGSLRTSLPVPTDLGSGAFASLRELRIDWMSPGAFFGFLRCSESAIEAVSLSHGILKNVVQSIVALPRLRSLTVSDSSLDVGAFFAALCGGAVALTDLALHRITAVMCVAKYPDLGGAALPVLSSLSVGECLFASDAFVKFALRLCPVLRVLTIGHCPIVGRVLLRHVQSKVAPVLNKIVLKGCVNLCPETVGRLNVKCNQTAISLSVGI